jgi:hypothetical protein
MEMDSGTVRDGYVPLSVRLYKKQQETERKLKGEVGEHIDNPLYMLSCGMWGEASYYIEDCTDPETGQPLGPGLIKLHDIQHCILNLALEMYLDCQDVVQHVGQGVEDGANQHLDQHVVTSTLSPISMGQTSSTPHIWGLDSENQDDDDDGVYSKRSTLRVKSSHHHHHHLEEHMFYYYIDNQLTLSISDRIHNYMRVIKSIAMGVALRFWISGSGTCNFRSPIQPSTSNTQSSTSNLNNLFTPNPDSLHPTIPSLTLSPDVDIDELAKKLGIEHVYHGAMEWLRDEYGSDDDGKMLKKILSACKFRWPNIVWSCPKKSGKTRIAAMVASWLAWKSGRFSEIYCVANDGKQSGDRVLKAVKKGIMLAKEAAGRGEKPVSYMADWDDTKMVVTLPDGQFIEAIPVDPTGEAGGQPTGTFFSELWGFGSNIEAKERLWTELTIPPTRWGYAIRWAESYAGYEGESGILWNLYVNGVDKDEYPAGQGIKHPLAGDLPVYINNRLGQFTYWDHEPRMPWQVNNPGYYESEAGEHSDSEFKRIHRNEWASPEGEVIPIERWDNLKIKMPGVSKNIPLVLGVDLSVSGDCTALVVVSMLQGGFVGIRAVQVWEPTPGHKIDYTQTIEKAIRYWCENFNVVTVVYDPYQAHKMVTDLRREGVAWFQEFAQGKGSKGKPGRPIGDKMFFDFVMSGKLKHGGDPIMREHIVNTVAEVKGEHHMRFVRRRTEGKIDSVVAASMAVCVISRLNLDEEELE